MNIVYPAKYKVHYWNEFKGQEYIATGITFGENFSDAVKMIEKYYGDSLMSISIELDEEQSVFELSDETVDE